MSEPVNGVEAMRILARKLRAKAEWDYINGYYSTDADAARNDAKREFAADLAELLDESFGFDSRLTKADHERRQKYRHTWQGESFKP